jgi:hypothetical protein
MKRGYKMQKTIFLSDFLNDKLKQASKDMGMSQSKLTEVALTVYLTMWMTTPEQTKRMTEVVDAVPPGQLSMLDDLMSKRDKG